MNVRWWKTAKSLAGTPAGEQTGLLPSTWQVRSVDGDICSSLIIFPVFLFVTASWRKEALKDPRAYYIQQINYNKPSKQAF